MRQWRERWAGSGDGGAGGAAAEGGGGSLSGGVVIDLGRRAVACKGWRWMPGMFTDTGLRVVAVYPNESQPNILAWITGTTRVLTYYLRPTLFVPDLADPATLGCVLALVREVYRDGSLTTRSRRSLRAHGDADSGLTDGPWDVVSTSEHVTISLHGTLAETEAEALVLALEAAPVLS